MTKDGLKINDQIAMLEATRTFSDTGEWIGLFAYPNCGWDLVLQGLATEDKKITTAGRAALFLLGKGDDPTDSKSSVTFQIPLNEPYNAELCGGTSATNAVSNGKP